MKLTSFPAHIDGHCPVCETPVRFSIYSPDLRNSFLCDACGTQPRERAITQVLATLYPNWRQLKIHESSPATRGLSLKLKTECPAYVETQFFPGQKLGATVHGFRNEDIERSTFANEMFDLVLTQDVMEHVNDLAGVIRDTMRTVKREGAHIFTTPTYMIPQSVQWATYVDGKIKWFFEPEYHGNPVDNSGSPVTYRFGYDLPDLIHDHTGYVTDVHRIHNPRLGIAGPMNEVYVVHKC